MPTLRTGLRITLVFLIGCFLASGCHTAFGIYHTVKKGETLYQISRTYDVSVKTLKEVNYLRNENEIKPGNQIFIPGADRPKSTEKVRKAASLERRPPGRKTPTGRSSTTQRKVTLRWPVDGVLTSGFGPRKGRMHSGIDIAAPIGTPIVAAAAGEVIYSDNKQRGYGNMIIIRHSENLVTIYAHNKINLVQEHDTVRRGEVIARVGRTGRATGPHVHFEVRKNRKAVDPLLYLP